jgi:hypothetical protein
MQTPAEKAIREAVIAVELTGCDSLLTDSVNLLSKALAKLGDYVDRTQQQALLDVYKALSEMLPANAGWHTFTVKCRRDQGVPVFFQPTFVADENRVVGP